MSAKEKLLAGWKLGLSFTKRDWELADYPVVIREQKIERDSEPSPSRGVARRYAARIVNWWVMTGTGDTPVQAMEELRDGFGRVKDARQRDSKVMPRPGTKVPIEFAPSDQVHSHPELTDEFIQRVLGLDWAFVSDQSSLWDFHTNDTNDALNTKIREIYGVDVSDVESGNLAEILQRIATSRSY
jgi:hypothetical protein